MKDDWIRDEYLEVKPILLYVKRKEPKEYYPIFIKRKDEFNLTLKCDFFKIKIKNTRVTASEVALILKPLLKSHHEINYVFFWVCSKSVRHRLLFCLCCTKKQNR